MRKTLFLVFLLSFFNTGIFGISLEEDWIAKKPYWSASMSGHVFVVSEWLPKDGCEEELWKDFKKLLAFTLKNESGCVRAHVTRQIAHPGAPGKSKYKIVLLQEYVDIKAFDFHCSTDYVAQFFKKCIENEETSLVEDWTCRLLSEGE